jgi:hypothetical protein
MTSHADYLASLERRAEAVADNDALLWPRTPIAGIQEKIRERVGVSDNEVTDAASRPASVLREVARLRASGTIGDDFSALDVACGDALVLLALKQAHPASSCFGIDLHAHEFEAHAAVEQAGVALYRGLIQQLVEQDAPAPFDIVLMLNTYRGWESADLRPHEHTLPRRVDDWLARNARFAIVTATRRQIWRLRLRGVSVRRIGPGEDAATMVSLRRRRSA